MMYEEDRADSRDGVCLDLLFPLRFVKGLCRKISCRDVEDIQWLIGAVLGKDFGTRAFCRDVNI